MLTWFDKTDQTVMTIIGDKQYQRTTTNFNSGRGNFFQQNSENNNINYKPKKNKMNLKTSRNNSDARQNLKITFRNTDYQSSPNTYAEAIQILFKRPNQTDWTE